MNFGQKRRNSTPFYENFKWVKNINFWFCSSVFLIIVLSFIFSVILFVRPDLGYGLKNNDSSYLGFFSYSVAKKAISLNWISYLLAFLCFVSVCWSSLTYWMYKNSSLVVFSNEKHYAAVLLVGNLFQLCFLLLCYINIPKIDYGSIPNLVHNNTLDLFKYFKPNFNFIYNFQSVSTTQSSYAIWKLSTYGVSSVVLVVIGWIAIIATNSTLLINRKKYM